MAGEEENLDRWKHPLRPHWVKIECIPWLFPEYRICKVDETTMGSNKVQLLWSTTNNLEDIKAAYFIVLAGLFSSPIKKVTVWLCYYYNTTKILESWANNRKGLPLNLRGIDFDFFLNVRGRLPFLYFLKSSFLRSSLKQGRLTFSLNWCWLTFFINLRSSSIFEKIEVVLWGLEYSGHKFSWPKDNPFLENSNRKQKWLFIYYYYLVWI
jgi:hypothetical protein